MGIKFAEHLAQIERARVELAKCKPDTPHRRDVAKRLKKLKREYAEAVRWVNGK